MAKAIQTSAPADPVVTAADYCSMRSLNKLDTLIFLKAMSGTDRFIRRSMSDWSKKYTDLYSRKG